MADEKLGMAAKAAKNWKKIKAKENIPMFDGYTFRNTDDCSRLRALYQKYGLHMTETLTLEEYLSPSEMNEELKSILIEIPISFLMGIWMFFDQAAVSWILPEYLANIEAFGNLFQQPDLWARNGYITFSSRRLDALNGQCLCYSDIPYKMVNGKLTFILPLIYVYPLSPLE